MKDPGEIEPENQALQERLTLPSEASLHINESLDLDSVLQGVLGSGDEAGPRYVVRHPARP